MKRQALVDELLTAGAGLHTVKRSGSVILRGESKRLKLSDGAKLTPAGKYYFKKQGVEWTGGFDPERLLKLYFLKQSTLYVVVALLALD